MAKTRPPRDTIINAPSSSSQSVKRSDLLNGKPRTTSAGSKGPTFTGGDDKTSWPCPGDPYGAED
jgi:hypothetical protein